MLFEDSDKNDTKISSGSNDNVIIDVVTENFMSDVIEKSKDIPVIVDFWAPWCEPCKQLTPIIEKLIKEQNGRVILAKMNIDESPEVAQQLKIQSIPAVMAFHDGQPLDGFIGVQPEKNILEFIKNVASKNNSSSIDQDLINARLELENGNFELALAVLQEILKIEPNNISAAALYSRCLLRIGKNDEAENFINSISGAVDKNQDYVSVSSEIELLKKAEKNPKDENHENNLRSKIDENPKDHQSRLDLSILLASNGNNKSAIDELLKIVEIDPKWNDGAGRIQLVEIFTALGSQDELVIEGRKRLSSLLFS